MDQTYLIASSFKLYRGTKEDDFVFVGTYEGENVYSSPEVAALPSPVWELLDIP